MTLFRNKFNQVINNQPIAIGVLFVLFAVYRVILLAMNSFPFNADEAIVGLMAKHILSGMRPLFFYGQAYMGSLDAFFVAGLFKVIGENVLTIRVVQSILFFLTVFNVYYFVIIAFQDRLIAFISGLFLIFAPVNLVLYSTVSLGGYGEALLIGSLVLLYSTLFIIQVNGRGIIEFKNYLQILLVGLLTGIGLWTNPLSLTFCVPAILAIFYGLFIVKDQMSKKVLCLFVLFVSFILGSYFWWYSLLATQNSSLIFELAGSAVSVEQGSYLLRIWQHLVSFLLFGPTVIFGFRPPWDVKIISPLLMLPVIIFWLIAFVGLVRKKDKITGWSKIFIMLLFGICLVQFIGFVFTSFGVDPSGRYFLPFYIPIAILGGYSIKNNSNQVGIFLLFLLVVFYNLYGTFSLARNNPKLTTQFYEPAQVDQSYMPQLIAFLQENDEYYGYSNYWVSYPLAFLSDEEIIAIPVLPYHADLRYSERDNRLADYTRLVEEQSTRFYITTKNEKLDQFLHDNFYENDVQYQYKVIGDYHIYYHLSRQISPLQLGLYENTP